MNPSVKKSVLILGGSQGIGKACADIFSSEYEVNIASRSGGALSGDLNEADFRKFT